MAVPLRSERRRNPFTSPPKIQSVLLRPARHKVLYGGRGSAKSWGVAEALVVMASVARIRVLCARELQVSINDSVHKLLVDTIYRKGLAHLFSVTKTGINCVATGSEFMFKGLRHNVSEIKSMEGIDIVWIEEAQRVSQESWETLIPTIRKEGSEIWLTMNPYSEDDPTYKRFIAGTPPDTVKALVNYTDNPHFPEVLRVEMEWLKINDYEAYEHIWLGKPKGRSKSQIFSGKYRIDVFEPPPGAIFYYGADWGFAQDPTVLIRCFIHERKLFIDHEAYGVGVELDEIPQLFDAVPGSRKWTIKADNARPETISHVANRGFSITAAEKWAGSVEDGIEFVRSFEEVVIHERAKHTADEFRLYSYKTDPRTEEVLPIVVDKHNHCIDAIRYALDQQIKIGSSALIAFFAAEKAKQDAAQQAAQQTEKELFNALNP